MAFYGKKEYWDERYSRATDPYEWYQSYQGIRHLLSPFHLTASDGVNPAKPRRILEMLCPSSSSARQAAPSFMSQHFPKVHIPPRKDCRILVLGCGNSRLGEDMIRDGWTGGIVCVDWSQIVINQMEAKYTPEYMARLTNTDSTFANGNSSNNTTKSKRLLEFRCANILEALPFDDCSFDFILCKGAFDSIVSASPTNAFTLNGECHRLLHPNHGALVVITHGNPESRLLFFENPPDEWWSEVAVHAIAKPTMDRRHLIANHDGSKFHYAYICRKRRAHKMANSASFSNEENLPLK